MSHIWFWIKFLLWSLMLLLETSAKSLQLHKQSVERFHWPVPVVDVGGISSLLNNPPRISCSPFGHRSSLVPDQYRLKIWASRWAALRHAWVLSSTVTPGSAGLSSWNMNHLSSVRTFKIKSHTRCSSFKINQHTLYFIMFCSPVIEKLVSGQIYVQ